MSNRRRGDATSFSASTLGCLAGDSVPSSRLCQAPAALQLRLCSSAKVIQRVLTLAARLLGVEGADIVTVNGQLIKTDKFDSPGSPFQFDTTHSGTIGSWRLTCHHPCKGGPAACMPVWTTMEKQLPVTARPCQPSQPCQPCQLQRLCAPCLSPSWTAATSIQQLRTYAYSHTTVTIPPIEQYFAPLPQPISHPQPTEAICSGFMLLPPKFIVSAPGMPACTP